MPIMLKLEVTPQVGYQQAHIEQGFNWSDIYAQVCRELAAMHIYVVVFRSRQHAQAKQDDLKTLDEKILADVQQVPEFIYYFSGEPDAAGYCLSFCLWTNPEIAQAASNSADHRQAKRSAQPDQENYNFYLLERYLLIGNEVRGNITFLPVIK